MSPPPCGPLLAGGAPGSERADIMGEVAALTAPEGEAALLRPLPAEARTEVFDLERLARVFDDAATAAVTRRLYRSRFVFFAAWCSSRGLRPVPAHPEVVRLYLMSLAAAKKSASTIKTAVAAIFMAHRLLGQELPRSNRLADAARKLGWPPGAGRPPIPVEALRRVVHACGGDALAVRDRALILVTLFADLRIAQTLALDCEDAARDAAGYALALHSSKDGAPSLRRLLPLDNPAFCPVHALDAWLDQRRGHPSGAAPSPTAGALFVGIRLGAGATFSLGKRTRPEDVRRILKRRARAAGLDPAILATQALRADPSTMALAFGAALPTAGSAAA